MLGRRNDMSNKIIFPVLLMVLLVSSCLYAQTAKKKSPTKFRRVFSWGILKNETMAKKYSEIGVTDILVRNEKQLKLALKYGITPYCGTFTPRGRHRQVMSEEEEKHFAYINGHDLKKINSAEKEKLVYSRRLEMNHRYGGEPVVELDTLNNSRIPCFLSDTNYELSKKAIDRICSSVKGAKGIFFDYIGYSNFRGCYCKDCLKARRKYLSKKGLVDNQKNRDIFYRDMLVKYYNDMIDYVKSKYPDFKVVVHIYPTFLPEPLYGNRTKADFCGQTVAWYFPWDSEKIAKYTRITVEDQNRYFEDVEGIPFVGLNRRSGSLCVKDAITLEKELQTILKAGGNMLMVCNGDDMIKPGMYEIFKKYCGKSEEDVQGKSGK
jgi:hypothetical protein